MQIRIAIVGAGIAGLACADVLAAAGAQVTLFDKGRGPGGRMSTRRVDTPAGQASFDHGAQYFTARAPAFAARVEDWAQAGIVARWPEAGEDAWVATPGMNALPRHLAMAHDIQQGALVRAMARMGDGWHLGFEQGSQGGFDRVVVALPAEQAAALLGMCDLSFGREAVSCPSAPCWTGMFVLAARADLPPLLRRHGPIAWAARNNAKPGRSGPEAWIVQADEDWTRARLEDDAASVADLLLRELEKAAGDALPPVLSAVAHRWRYARSGNAGHGFLWNAQLGLGACGDWLAGPRIESAWLSGHRLGETMVDALGPALVGVAAQ